MKKNNNNGKSVYTVESLEKEVELVQIELHEVLSQKALLDAENAQVEQSAQLDLETARSKRKTDDISRAQLKSESKNLEELKHQLDTQKVKVEKANKTLSADLDKMAAEKQKWVDDMESAKLEVSQIDASLKSICDDGNLQVSAAQQELDELIASNNELEEDIKRLTASKKSADILKSASLEALIQVRGQLDTNTGIIHDEYLASFLDNKDIHKKLKVALKKDSDLEKSLEEEWAKTQKDLEKRYVTVNGMYLEAKSSYDAAVETYNLRNSGEPSNENRLAPAISNHSTGKKRRNRSRRNTRTNNNAHPSPTASHHQTAPYPPQLQASPSNSHGRPSVSPQYSPTVPVPLLNAHMGAMSHTTNTPALLLDTQIPSSPPTADLQSPSSLLPSYLLTDDVTESLGNIFGKSLIHNSDAQDLHILDNLISQQWSTQGSLPAVSQPAEREEIPESGLIAPNSFDSTFQNKQVTPQSSFSHLFQQQRQGLASSAEQVSIRSPSYSQSSPESQRSTQYSTDEIAKPPSKGKLSNMFFFSKRDQKSTTSASPSNQGSGSSGGSLFFRRNNHRHENAVDESTSFPNSAEDQDSLQQRARSGSINSMGSLPMSLGESFNASGMLNLWNEPTGKTGLALEPSRSHISTTLSADRNPNSNTAFGGSGILGTNQLSGFDSQSSGLAWSSFTNVNRSSSFLNNSFKDDKQLEATWGHMPNDTINHQKSSSMDKNPVIGTPRIVVDSASGEGTDTVAEVPSSPVAPPKTPRFSKRSFVGLFTSGSSDHSNSRPNSSSKDSGPTSAPLSEEQNDHSSLSDGMETDSKDSSGVGQQPATSIASPPVKETILQKGIRTFKFRESSSASNSSKDREREKEGGGSKEGKSSAAGLAFDSNNSEERITGSSGSAASYGKEDVALSISSTPMPATTGTSKSSKFTMKRLSMFGKKDTNKDGATSASASAQGGVLPTTEETSFEAVRNDGQLMVEVPKELLDEKSRVKTPESGWVWLSSPKKTKKEYK